MKQSQVNHLRRLLGWVKCEVGQTPDEMVSMLKDMASKGLAVEDEAAQRRLVEAHDKARGIPKYVREAIKALEPLTRPGDVVAGDVREVKRITS